MIAIKGRRLLLLGGAFLLVIGASEARPTQETAAIVDPNLKGYHSVPSLTGTLTSVGSDTLNPLMKAWSELFRGFYPAVEVHLEGKGSNTAPPALLDGTAQLSPMSRALKATEIEAFEKKFGYKPRGIRAAVDSICIFVHKDNPLRSITLEQVDAIFSKTRLRGGRELRTWGELGLTGEWADRPIRTTGRNVLSGTHQFFKDHALKGGSFRDDLKEQEGSALVIKEVSTDPGAIGYSGVGYATSGVRALPLAESAREAAVEPTAANAYAGEYPLSRILFVYFNHPPGRPQDSAVREFIRMICSREGQEVVLKEGYFPMPAAVAKEELAKTD